MLILLSNLVVYILPFYLLINLLRNEAQQCWEY